MLSLEPIEEIMKLTSTSKEEIDEVILVGGMTQIPYLREIIKNKLKKPNCSLDPSYTIAAGAALQGYIISNKNSVFSPCIKLIDVTSLSLGIEIIGDVMDVIVPRKTPLPCEVSKMYTTDCDNMKSVMINYI